MRIHLQPSDNRPLYVQIMDEVRRAVVAGTLHAEDPLPSVRELAGLDRVVFGTDWPFLTTPEDVDVTAGLRLDATELARVEHANPATLIPRWAEETR